MSGVAEQDIGPGGSPDRRSLVPRLLEAGPRAPLVLAQAAVESLAVGADRYAQDIRGQAEVEELVARVISSHRKLARLEGVTAGAAVSFAEMTTIVGSAGTLTLPAAAVTLTGDLVGLAWIQVRMTLVIAALHGHNPRDGDRVQELLMLTGVYGAGPAGGASKAAAEGSQRVAKRLIMRHLRGDALKTVTQLFRFVGIKFSRAGLLRALPMVNMPINAVVNDQATSALGAKAADYYRTLPAPRRAPAPS